MYTSAEDDERQRADDVGRRLRFRAHRADLELHLRALAKHVGQVRQGLGQVAAGLALDGQRDDEELELRQCRAGRRFPAARPPSCGRSSSCRTTARNSSPTGPRISPATMPSVSVIGRPERRPRTISSIASGKFELNLLTRRLIILPMTKCGRPMPTNRPANRPSRNGAPLHHQQRPRRTAAIPSEIIAYLAERDVACRSSPAACAAAPASG